jgi:aspartyl-tRNA(Asn)/glutamyl-tRNA(Gln) amidotransferase subunit C
MQINKETIGKIAHLARLQFSENEEANLQKSMTDILNWMEKLNEIDTDHIEPLTHMSEEINKMREDEALPPLDHNKALFNAPVKDLNYFRVPKVIE